MSKVLRLVVVGGPGSGKGTQGQIIANLLKLTHISTGEVFRDHIRRDTELGRLAHQYIGQGRLVPDDVATRLLQDILNRLSPDEGFILDGYPRSLAQARDLESILLEKNLNLDAVLYLKVSDEEIVRRLGGRLVCRRCQRSFHREFAKPQTENICDHCGGELFRRSDDNPDTIRQRIRVFHKMTEPLIAFYRGNGLLTEIDAEGLPEKVKEKVETVARSLSFHP